MRLGDVSEAMRHTWRRDRRGCPGDEDLAASSESRLPWQRRLGVWWHVWRCALCRADLADLHEALAVIAASAPPSVTLRSPLPTREAQPLRRWWPWMLAGAEAVAMLILILLFSLQRADLERQAQLRMEVREAIEEGLQDAVHLLRLADKAPNQEVVAAAQQIHVIPAVSHGKVYPYPTWQYEPTNPAALSEGLSRFPDLESEYEEYLQEWIDIFLDLGVLLFEAGKLPEAIQVVVYLRDTYPDDKRLLFVLGGLYIMARDYRKAIAIFEDMMARGLAQQDPRPAHYAGWSYSNVGDAAAALKYYDAALRIDPGYAKVFYNKALVFRDLGQERRYQEHLDKALTLTLQAYDKEGNANPRIPFTRALLSVARGELDDALVYLEQAIQRERLYIARAEYEPAFAVFRDRANEPYAAQFRSLLDRYRPPPRTSRAYREATYDPSVFHE